MFTNWNAALKRRAFFIEKGATDVVIIAVWLKGLARVYDAYEIAGAFGIHGKKRDVHLYEVLLWGGISADEYRILAAFGGVGQTLPAVLSLPGLSMAVRLPPAFIRGVQEKTEIATSLRPDATSRLRDEIYMRGGVRDDSKLYRLALSIGGCGYTSNKSSQDKREILRMAWGLGSWEIISFSVAES
jgi:hypothetical protein